MRETGFRKLKSIYRFCEKVLFVAFLALYPLRHIRVGVEWWDTGYNYGNFTYMDRMDPMWVFSTYLGNALGHFFTKLPLGGMMLGLNLYTSLLISLLAVTGYFFFVKKIKVPAWIAFAGEVLAISLCWCPSAVLYNYLTYVLMAAGVLGIYHGLSEEKRGALVFAGACLGVNVFVRFPNLAQMGFIVAVWAYGLIRKKKFREVAAWTGWCVLGYAAGVLLCLGYLAAAYGLPEYVSSIARLLGMPSEASDYTLYSMIVYQIVNYEQNLIWLGYLAFFTFLGILGFAVLPGKLMRLKKAGYVVCVFLGFYYLMQRNMFNLKYSTKLSVFQWAAFLLTATLIVGTVTIFRKGADHREKLLAGLLMLVILITPLGSNNHLYSSINNLFLVAPFTLWMLVRLLVWLPEGFSFRLAPYGRREWRVGSSYFPVKAMICCMLLSLAVQSLCFGVVYVFSEGDGGENLHTSLEHNAVLRGMYTSPDRAAVLNSLSAYVEEEGLSGKEVILYGKIPALSYYLQMPFAITAWPDLASYNYAVMEEDLRQLSERIASDGGEAPVVLLEAKLRAGLAGEEAVEDAKFLLLKEWMEPYGYREAFQNGKFILLRADGE